jgi:hypothetical protein
MSTASKIDSPSSPSSPSTSVSAASTASFSDVRTSKISSLSSKTIRSTTPPSTISSRVPSKSASGGGSRPAEFRPAVFTMDKTSEKAQRVFTQKLGHGEGEGRFSSMGHAANSLNSDVSGAYRTVLTAPIPGWSASPNYPDMPNSPLFQAMGGTTALHSLWGIKNFVESIGDGLESRKIGDTTGVGLAVTGALTSASQAGMGIGYSVVRANNIGQFFSPSGTPLDKFAPAFTDVGSGMGTALYGFATIGEAVKLKSSADFTSEYQAKKSVGAKAKYLKESFGLDRTELQDEALSEATATDIEKAGFEYLRPLAKRNIELLQKHGKLAPMRITAENTDEYIKKFLGSGNEDNGLTAVKVVGQEVLIERLRAKRCAKMGRALGDKGFKVVLEQIQNASKLKGKKAVKAADKLNKIVLGELDTVKSSRKKRLAAYAIGAITMGILGFLTGGGAIAALLVVAAVLYTGVALYEFYLSYQAFEEQRKATDAPPGRYDEYLAALPGIAVATLTLTLAGIFSLGTIPLVIGVIGGVLMLGRSLMNGYAVRERRENYCNALMAKKEITFDEFVYIVENSPAKKILEHNPLLKLAKKEKKAIERLKSADTSGRTEKEKLLEAIEKRKIEHEKEVAEALWSKSKTTNWVGAPMMILPSTATPAIAVT